MRSSPLKLFAVVLLPMFLLPYRLCQTVERAGAHDCSAADATWPKRAEDGPESKTNQS
jgi:hypothetical protein